MIKVSIRVRISVWIRSKLVLVGISLYSLIY